MCQAEPAANASGSTEPQGSCPFCGYPLDPGRCPECGETVASFELGTSNITAKVVKWERYPIGVACITIPLYMSSFLMALMNPQVVPRIRIVSRHHIMKWIVLVVASISISALSDVRELLYPLALLRGATRGPTVNIMLFSVLVCIILGISIRRNGRLFQSWWRATGYGMCLFATIHMAWVVWNSLSLCRMPVYFGIVQHYSETTPDPSLIELFCFYTSVIVSMANPILFVLVLPLNVLIVERQYLIAGEVRLHRGRRPS